VKFFSGFVFAACSAIAACGKSAKSPAAHPEPPTTVAHPPAVAPAPEPGAQTPQPTIVSVQPQWIISNSSPKMEITLFGQDLARDASVVSNSPYITVESVDPDPARTIVTASLAPNTPPGDYELLYTAPGSTPIPFKIHYQAPPR
jgi:hypothetical protein